MQTIFLKNCEPKQDFALGATLAQQHMSPLVDRLAKGRFEPGELIIFDFKGISGANGSYIKSTVLWLLECGRLSSKGATIFESKRSNEPRPFDVYTAVTGLNKEIAAEFNEFFEPRSIPILNGNDFEDNVAVEAKLLGKLEPALSFTLKALIKQSKGTAPSLHIANPNEGVEVTAWNNRLNELHALRLVRRTRSGRAWQYEPLAKEIIWE